MDIVMNLQKTLQKLCQITSSSEISAIDYERCCVIPATTPHPRHADTIAELRMITQRIKSFCNSDELAFFEFYFEWCDVQTDSIKSILHLAKLLAENNQAINCSISVAALIVKKFRNPRIRADLVIAQELSCHPGHARKIIKANQFKLTTLLNQFINTDYLLADNIEKLLIQNDVLLDK